MTHPYIEHLQENTYVTYDRPVFYLPKMNSPEANTFFLFKSFLKYFQAQGYNTEYQFIQNNFVAQDFGEFAIPKNNGFSRNDYLGVIEMMNKFCDLTNEDIIEETDEYIITKIKKNTKSLKNIPLFSKAKLSIAQVMLEDEDTKADLLEKNNFNRNILHYLPVLDAIKLVSLDQKLSDSSLDIDVFGQYFFSYKINLINFKDIMDFLEKKLNLTPDEINNIIQNPDAFNKTGVDYLLSDMDKKFPSLKSFYENFDRNRYSSQHHESISHLTEVYVEIINATYTLMKYDAVVGETLYGAIFNKASPHFENIGVFFQNLDTKIQEVINNRPDAHPSFYEFSKALRELKLLKDIEKVEESNPSTSKSIKSKQKI